MRAVVQRVSRAQVSVDGQVVGRISQGLCVLVGVLDGDTSGDAAALAKKVASLRVFTDAEDKMNLSVKDIEGKVLAISQFTLAGDVRKGNRPSFKAALAPEPAKELFGQFCDQVRSLGLPCEEGTFQAHMEVELVNDGPVTILLDTTRTF